jgi:hypothetical protein
MRTLLLLVLSMLCTCMRWYVITVVLQHLLSARKKLSGFGLSGGFMRRGLASNFVIVLLRCAGRLLMVVAASGVRVMFSLIWLCTNTLDDL